MSKNLTVKNFKVKCNKNLKISSFNKSYESILKDQNKMKLLYEKNKKQKKIKSKKEKIKFLFILKNILKRK